MAENLELHVLFVGIVQLSDYWAGVVFCIMIMTMWLQWSLRTLREIIIIIIPESVLTALQLFQFQDTPPYLTLKMAQGREFGQS